MTVNIALRGISLKLRNTLAQIFDLILKLFHTMFSVCKVGLYVVQLSYQIVVLATQDLHILKNVVKVAGGAFVCGYCHLSCGLSPGCVAQGTAVALCRPCSLCEDLLDGTIAKLYR